MYNRQFFSTRLGQAALLSVAAMVAFNLMTIAGSFDLGPTYVALMNGTGTLA